MFNLFRKFILCLLASCAAPPSYEYSQTPDYGVDYFNYYPEVYLDSQTFHNRQDESFYNRSEYYFREKEEKERIFKRR